MCDNEVLRLRGIEVRRGGVSILQGVNWSVCRGQNWVLFGPNGAGKTTMLNLLTGYLWPTSGKVQVLDQTLGNVDVRELRRLIGLVSDPLLGMMHEELTGFEVLVTGIRAHLNLFEEPGDEELARAEEVARITNTQMLMEKTFGVMSTGERKRLLIARALMPRPKLLILDEPCAGLDLAGREFVLQTLQAVAAQPDAPTLLLTTHHVEEITPLFTHAFLLRQGQRFACGAISRVLTSDNVSQLFGVPISVWRQNGRWAAGFQNAAHVR